MLFVLLLLGAPTLFAALLGYFCSELYLEAKKKADNAFVAGLVLFTMITCVVAVFLLIFNLENASAARRMEGFYYENANVYQQAVTETQNALYMNLALVQQIQLASVENMKQSTNVSERLKEFRDRVVLYNEFLRSSRYFNKSIWTNWFVRAPSPDLKPIQLTNLSQ